MWKLANITPISKPNKSNNISNLHRVPISFPSTLTQTPGKTILPYIRNNILHIITQHSYKRNCSTDTALHNINNINVKLQPKATTSTHNQCIAIDMSNIYKLSNNPIQINTPNTITKFIAN